MQRPTVYESLFVLPAVEGIKVLLKKAKLARKNTLKIPEDIQLADAVLIVKKSKGLLSIDLDEMVLYNLRFISPESFSKVVNRLLKDIRHAKN